MALGETCEEASWFKGLFRELGIRMDGPVPIGGASQDTEEPGHGGARALRQQPRGERARA
jgi:hypothetical protein